MRGGRGYAVGMFGVVGIVNVMVLAIGTGIATVICMMLVVGVVVVVVGGVVVLADVVVMMAMMLVGVVIGV